MTIDTYITLLFTKYPIMYLALFFTVRYDTLLTADGDYELDVTCGYENVSVSLDLDQLLAVEAEALFAGNSSDPDCREQSRLNSTVLFELPLDRCSPNVTNVSGY